LAAGVFNMMPRHFCRSKYKFEELLLVNGQLFMLADFYKKTKAIKSAT
jgi:hypothetical protein